MALAQTAHDLLVRRLRVAARAVDLRNASDAFLASLTSGPLRGRPTLAHLAYATNFPEHRFAPNLGDQSYMCSICGESAEAEIDREEILGDLEKGDTIVASVTSALVDLETFVKLPPMVPQSGDIACFNAMLEVLSRLPPEGRATDLVKKWKVPRTNAYGRAALVETFGVCGLLETPDHHGHLTRWVPFWEYEEVPSLGGEARPPEAWWRRRHGLDRRALDHVFPQLGITRKAFEKSKPQRRPIAKGTVTIPKKGAHPSLELRPGDLVGIGYEERWLAGVVAGVDASSGTRLPVVEFYDGSWARRPDPKTVARATARVVGPYREAPTWRREPLALEGLELFGSVMPVVLERIARDQPLPNPNGAPATTHRAIAPRNLLYLLGALLAPTPKRV